MRLIKLVLEHDDWASTIPSNVQARTIKSIPNGNKDLINALILIKAPNTRTIKETLYIIKKNERIKNIEVLGNAVTRSYAMVLLSILAKYTDSITEIAVNTSAIFSEHIHDNKEYWTFLINSKSTEGILIQDIKEKAEVLSYYHVDIKNIFKNYTRHVLTDNEHKILRAAYEQGYFEWPKNANAEEISKSLNINKVTFIQELRRAIRKLVLKELDSDNIDFMGFY